MEFPQGKPWIMIHGRRDVLDALLDILIKNKFEDARQAWLQRVKVATKNDACLMEQNLAADIGVLCQHNCLKVVVERWMEGGS